MAMVKFSPIFYVLVGIISMQLLLSFADLVTSFVLIDTPNPTQENQYDDELDCLKALKAVSTFASLLIMGNCILGLIAVFLRHKLTYYVFLGITCASLFIMLALSSMGALLISLYEIGCQDVENCYSCTPPEGLSDYEIDEFCDNAADLAGDDCYYLDDDFESICSGQYNEVRTVVVLMGLTTAIQFVNMLFTVGLRNKFIPPAAEKERFLGEEFDEENNNNKKKKKSKSYNTLDEENKQDQKEVRKSKGVAPPSPRDSKSSSKNRDSINSISSKYSNRDSINSSSSKSSKSKKKKDQPDNPFDNI